MKLKIRASQQGKIMSYPKTKKEKEAGELSDVGKTYVSELFIAYKYDRIKDIDNQYVRKGIEVEEKALSLFTEVDNTLYTKNEKTYTDEWFTGTPDIITKNEIIDIKSSFDIFTFHNAKPPYTPTGRLSLYGWQLMVYMHLTGCKTARLVYCLVDTPEWQLNDMLYRLHFKFPDGDESEAYKAAAEELRARHIYNDISSKEKVKQYFIHYDPELIEQAIERVKAARKYYEKLKL